MERERGNMDTTSQVWHIIRHVNRDIHSNSGHYSNQRMNAPEMASGHEAGSRKCLLDET